MITKQQIYALQAMRVLAANRGQVVSMKIICEQEDIPYRFLVNTLQYLRKAGIIDIEKGSKGGPVLRRDPIEISLLAVIVAIGGPFRFSEGTDGEIKKALDHAQEAFEEALDWCRINELEDEE